MPRLLNRNDIKYSPDNPLDIERGDKDWLDFEVPAKQFLEQMLASDAVSLPLTVGIYGDWGAGKTSFLKHLEKQAKKAKISTTWFNAWKFENEASIAVTLLATIGEKHRNIWQKWACDPWKNLAKNTSSSIESVNVGVVNISPKSIYEWVFKRNTVESDFKKLIQKISKQSTGNRTLIFIDDLDRCAPESAVRLLDDIKILFTAQETPCIFVIALDKKSISSHIAHKYRLPDPTEIFADEYLEKIISISYNLPALTSEKIKKFVTQFLNNHVKVEATGPHWELVKTVCANTLLIPNPRKLRKIIFRFLLFMTHDDWWTKVVDAAIEIERQHEQSPLASLFKTHTHPDVRRSFTSALYQLSKDDAKDKYKTAYEHVYRSTTTLLSAVLSFISLIQISPSTYDDIIHWNVQNVDVLSQHWEKYPETKKIAQGFGYTESQSLHCKIYDRLHTTLFQGESSKIGMRNRVKKVLPWVIDLYSVPQDEASNPRA